MGIFMQLLINSLIAGAIYALVASGFSLIYSTSKIIHFAHGAVIALSAYVLYFLFSSVGINFWVAAFSSVIFAALLGLFINSTIYRTLRKQKASPVIILIASFAVLIFIESLILLLFGADVKTIRYIRIAKGMEFLGAIITPLQLYIIIISLILFAFFFIFMKQTKLGKATRAVADNKEVAAIVGISPEKIYNWSFIIGSAVAGVAAVLVGLEQSLEPLMGTNLMIKGFTGAIIGGLGSVPGAILGAFILGLAENFGIWYLPSGYKDAIAFGILFIFLLFKSRGILGIKKQGENQ